MATPIQRAVAISNNLINGVATATQIDRVGKALAWRYGRLAEYEAGDNTIKSQIYMDCILRSCIETMKDFEAKQAIQNAGEVARLQVEADFQQTP